MFMREECKYYAPCGLCTYYGEPCSKICGTKTKYIGSSALTPTDNPPHEKIIPFMKERE